MTTRTDRVRTRFAPSPTGFMHIGNLRTALYEYLVARAQGGRFVLRIEDTDQERQVEGALEKIYATLKAVGLQHDEGPDIGGPYAPYVQSERKDVYRPVAEQLVKDGKAYYCFCTPERLEKLHEEQQAASEGSEEKATFIGYDRHCRHLTQEEIEAKLQSGAPYVIRQKMPTEGETTFHDEVFGDITVENKTLEDQVLLKSDGFPTYNFANVVDDHAMAITHVVRGSEYLSSTPKYELLYDALGYESPAYIHLPLILGPDGRKLSKRHGATSFEDLTEDGYLPEAIINYLALLGWSPSASTREMFTLAELEEHFTVSGINKSPAVFSQDKLDWFNGEYLKKMDPSDFVAYVRPELTDVLPQPGDTEVALAAELLQTRITRDKDIPEMLSFLKELPDYDPEIFVHKRSKSDEASSLRILRELIPVFEATDEWAREPLTDIMKDYASAHDLKNGTVMWPTRIAAAGQKVTPGGAAEMMVLLGRDETLRRFRLACERLDDVVATGADAADDADDTKE